MKKNEWFVTFSNLQSLLCSQLNAAHCLLPSLKKYMYSNYGMEHLIQKEAFSVYSISIEDKMVKGASEFDHKLY